MFGRNKQKIFNIILLKLVPLNSSVKQNVEAKAMFCYYHYASM